MIGRKPCLHQQEFSSEQILSLEKGPKVSLLKLGAYQANGCILEALERSKV
jgi:hypothetical protein